jgi:hypothetical protein
MAQLAIKGHATRGKEVIEILTMLGGKTHTTLCGNLIFRGYYIGLDGFIDYKYHYVFSNSILYSLEEFLEKFPYKVGDKVKVCGDNLGVIISMRWEIEYVVYKVKLSKNGYETNKTSDNLQLYKEETMEEKTNTALTLDLKLKGEDYSDRRFCYKIPNGYEIECVRENEIILKPVKPQYPKTYEECCKVLNLTKYPPALVPNKAVYINQYKDFPYYYEIQKLAQLLVCRNAYWKIAGEEMGLGKPWNPCIGEWAYEKFVIQTVYDEITCLDTWCQTRNILEFPTPEIRDAFYENFKELIELVKELL